MLELGQKSLKQAPTQFVHSCACLLGCGLQVVAFAFILVHEHRVVCVHRAFSLALRQHRDLDCIGVSGDDIAGAPVHFSCPVKGTSLPQWTPEHFNVSSGLSGAFAFEAISARQEVSMFQCQEERRLHKNKQGKLRVHAHAFTYMTVWSNRWINSSGFKGFIDARAQTAMAVGCGSNFRGNALFPIQSKSRSAEALVAGVFDVTHNLGQLPAATPVHIAPGSYTLPTDANSISGNIALHLDGNELSTCVPSALEIGCLRVSYWQTTATHISGLGALANKTDSLWNMTAWTAPSCWMCGDRMVSAHVDLLVDGDEEAHEMVWIAQTSSDAETWFYRSSAVVMAVLGFYLCLQSLQKMVGFLKHSPLGTGRLRLDVLSQKLSNVACYKLPLVSIGIAMPTALSLMGTMWCILSPTPGISGLFGGSAMLIFLSVKCISDSGTTGSSLRGKAF